MTDDRPKRKRTVKPPEERQRELLDAAVEIFVRDGVADARIEDITELAGVSKGTFYSYFASKDEIAAAAWQRYMSEFTALGEAIVRVEAVPIGDRLIDVIESLTRFVLEHEAMHRTLYSVGGSEAVKAVANEQMITLIAVAARVGIQAGVISCREPELTARTLFHGVCGAANDAIMAFVPLDRDALISEAGRMTRVVFSIT